MSGPQYERGTFNQFNLDDSEPLESATDLNKSNALLGAVIGASLAASLVVRPESSRMRRAIEFSTVALSGLVGAAAVNWQPIWQRHNINTQVKVFAKKLSTELPTATNINS